MGDISEHFDRSEHECKCGCGFDTVDVKLSQAEEMLRNHFKAPVIVMGPNRCPFHNAATPGAAKGSLHMEGKAADYGVQDVTPQEVYDYLEKKFPGSCGIGLYHNRVHFDVRPVRARWDKTK